MKDFIRKGLKNLIFGKSRGMSTVSSTIQKTMGPLLGLAIGLAIVGVLIGVAVIGASTSVGLTSARDVIAQFAVIIGVCVAGGLAIQSIGGIRGR